MGSYYTSCTDALSGKYQLNYVVQSGPIFPCPLGEDVVAEVVGGGQHPPIVASQLRPSPYGEEDVPQGSDKLALVGLWSHSTAPELDIKVA